MHGFQADLDQSVPVAAIRGEAFRPASPDQRAPFPRIIERLAGGERKPLGIAAVFVAAAGACLGRQTDLRLALSLGDVNSGLYCKTVKIKGGELGMRVKAPLDG